MSERREQILERLNRGVLPTEAEVRWLLTDNADKEQTIRVLTDAALKFAHSVTDLIDHRRETLERRLPLGVFDEHAGQFIDQ